MDAELNRAIRAGYEALRNLEKAESKLNTSKNWGIVDMVGGGFISGLAKHSGMNDANKYMKRAEKDLRVFNECMGHVNIPNIKLKTKDLIGLLDIFHDGLLSDLLMQSRIKDARREVKRAIKDLRKVLSELENYR